MNSFDSATARDSATPDRAPTQSQAAAVLASEGGLPYQAAHVNRPEMDPIVEWLSLMEVVQMLCPVWPVRKTPMVGDHWKL